MKKILTMALVMVMLLCATAYAETLTGTAKGFGGELTVSVTLEGDVITGVEVTGHSETNGIGTLAIDQIPDAITQANGTDVDVVAGATVTSKAIIDAVNNAIDPEQYPYEAEVAAEPQPLPDADTYFGFGIDNSGRIGPGSDAESVPVYSINQVFVSATFDREGRILSIYIDQLEVATPNYDGETMPHFSGFPGQGGYNWDENHDEVITGKTEDTEENFQAEIASWKTKRERGAGYVMGTGTWTDQIETYQAFFIGKTVDELDAWFADYCSDRNGRPLKDGSSNEQDAAKYTALTDEEKAMLADVTTSATMSLNDSHGNILGAIRNAFENRIPIQ